MDIFIALLVSLFMGADAQNEMTRSPTPRVENELE